MPQSVYRSPENLFGYTKGEVEAIRWFYADVQRLRVERIRRAFFRIASFVLVWVR